VRLEKQLAGSEERPDDFGSLIVNPSTLKQEQSLLVCSRCHGKMIAKQQYDRQCLTDGDFLNPVTGIMPIGTIIQCWT